MKKSFILVLLLLIAFSSVFSSEEKIEKIFKETKKEVQLIMADTSVSGIAKRVKLKQALSRNKRRLNQLKSFYLTRHMFKDSKLVKAAIKKFEKQDFSKSAETRKPVVAKKPSENDDGKIKEITGPPEEEAAEKTFKKYFRRGRRAPVVKDDPIKDEKPKLNIEPDFDKKKLTYQHFIQMTPAKQKHWVDKLVTLEKDGFFTVHKSYYTLKTDVSKLYALKQAVFMDEFSSSFKSIFKGDFKMRGSPVLYITATRSGFFDLLALKGINAPPWAGGLYSPYKKMLVGYKEAGDFLKDVLYHEGTHQLLHFYTNKRMPPWFNEGTATNFETWNPLKPGLVNNFESQFKSDRLDYVANYHKRTKFKKADFIRMMKMSGMQWNNSSQPGPNYSKAWSMINFCFHTKTGRKLFNKLISGIMKGKSIKRTLSPEQMDELAKAWIVDLNERQIPVHDIGRPLYKEIVKWAKTSMYNTKLANKLAYQAEQYKGTTVEFEYLIAMHKMVIGKYEEALSELLELSEKEKGLPYIYSAIANCYKNLDDRKEAIRYVKKAYAQNYKDPLAARL